MFLFSEPHCICLNYDLKNSEQELERRRDLHFYESKILNKKNKMKKLNSKQKNRSLFEIKIQLMIR